jgi:hypothetical protein
MKKLVLVAGASANKSGAIGADTNKNGRSSKSHQSRRNILNYLVVVAIVVSAVFTSCGGGGGGKMTMTTKGSGVRIVMKGYGTATVDWGNGVTTEELSERSKTDYEWKYSQASQHTIKIIGGNIQYLSINGNQLTRLDVGKNTALKELYCRENQLTSLNVGKNTALTYLGCYGNQFSAKSLNALFKTLHSNGGSIYIGDNPGTNDCDRSIATNKGWEVK